MSSIEDQKLTSDVWSRWLLHGRNGGDAGFERILRSEVEAYVDRILDQAQLGPGMTLVDVGTGEGAVAFRAIERFGPTLRVILTDISQPLLRRARERAARLGVLGQCTFAPCGAEHLLGIENDSVDVVTTRSVLAYVRDKIAAFREFNRVLRPGGRISLAEPIFQDDAFQACVLKSSGSTERDPAQERLRPLLHRWKAAQFPDTPEGIAADPLTNFSERTLFDLICTSGFSPVHLELHMDMLPSQITSWHVFVESSPHPLALPLIEILEKGFSDEERRVFEATYRPLIESGRAMTVQRMAFLSANKSVTRVTSAL